MLDAARIVLLVDARSMRQMMRSVALALAVAALNSRGRSATTSRRHGPSPRQRSGHAKDLILPVSRDAGMEDLVELLQAEDRGNRATGRNSGSPRRTRLTSAMRARTTMNARHVRPGAVTRR